MKRARKRLLFVILIIISFLSIYKTASACFEEIPYLDVSKNESSYHGHVNYNNNQNYYYYDNDQQKRNDGVSIGGPMALVIASPKIAKQIINGGKEVVKGIRSFFRKITGRDRREQEELAIKQQEEKRKKEKQKREAEKRKRDQKRFSNNNNSSNTERFRGFGDQKTNGGNQYGRFKSSKTTPTKEGKTEQKYQEVGKKDNTNQKKDKIKRETGIYEKTYYIAECITDYYGEKAEEFSRFIGSDIQHQYHQKFLALIQKTLDFSYCYVMVYERKQLLDCCTSTVIDVSMLSYEANILGHNTITESLLNFGESVYDYASGFYHFVINIDWYAVATMCANFTEKLVIHTARGIYRGFEEMASSLYGLERKFAYSLFYGLFHMNECQNAVVDSATNLVSAAVNFILENDTDQMIDKAGKGVITLAKSIQEKGMTALDNYFEQTENFEVYEDFVALFVEFYLGGKILNSVAKFAKNTKVGAKIFEKTGRAIMKTSTAVDKARVIMENKIGFLVLDPKFVSMKKILVKGFKSAKWVNKKTSKPRRICSFIEKYQDNDCAHTVQ